MQQEGLTLASRLFTTSSRRGSLKRRVTPSKLTLRVIKVSGVVDDEAIFTGELMQGRYQVSFR